MQFSTAFFILCFFPIFLMAFYISSDRKKDGIIFAFSLLFYAWNGGVGLLVLLSQAIVSYVLCYQMQKTKPKHRTVLMVVGISINVFALAHFKYSYWLLGLFGMTEFPVAWLRTHFVPLGISFYTFSLISFIVDVYWEKITTIEFIALLKYVVFFPKIVMGPIMRSADYAAHYSRINKQKIFNGLERITKGLFKKTILADNIARIADYIYSLSTVDTGTAWIGVIAYMLQLYYDFSGYCDIAIGIGWMVGVEIPENFDHPYMSESVGEYWRRWHITLGAWLKDYIYMPVFRRLLEKGVSKNICDIVGLFVVWLIAGIWHGAGATYILYGLWYFAAIGLERTYNIVRKKYKKIGLYFPKDEKWFVVIKHIKTIIIIAIGQNIFRSSDMQQASMFLKAMFGFDFAINNQLIIQLTPGLILWIILGIAFCFPIYKFIKNYIYNCFSNKKEVMRYMKSLYSLILLLAFGLTIIHILSTGNRPFLYEIY